MENLSELGNVKISCRSFPSACFTLHSSLCFFFLKKRRRLRGVHGLYSRPQLPHVHTWSRALGLAPCTPGIDLHACQTQATPGSRRSIRSVTHSQAPFAPEASDSSRPPRLTPRTPELGLRSRAGAGNGTSQSFPSESPRLCPGALEQGFHDSGRRMESLPQIPPRRKNQNYKPRTLLYR